MAVAILLLIVVGIVDVFGGRQLIVDTVNNILPRQGGQFWNALAMLIFFLFGATYVLYIEKFNGYKVLATSLVLTLLAVIYIILTGAIVKSGVWVIKQHLDPVVLV